MLFNVQNTKYPPPDKQILFISWWIKFLQSLLRQNYIFVTSKKLVLLLIALSTIFFIYCTTKTIGYKGR